MAVSLDRWWMGAPGVVLGCVLMACSAYDSELVEVHAQAKSGGLGGSGGSHAMTDAGGGGGGVSGSSGTGSVTSGVSGGGSGGSGGSAGSRPPGDVPVGSPVLCGDGEVDLSEKCDISIAAGMIGACPTECKPLADCRPRELDGSNCQAECLELEVTCENDDGCCGPKCDRSNDNDCPANCGDRMVQDTEGETCEPGTDTPCPSVEDCDDGKACTDDKLEGSAENCNAKCSNTDITTAKSGDGCCPPDANHNVDTDCTVLCGNGVREMGEECDGGEGCDENCKQSSVLTDDQKKCLDLLPDGANDCDMCSCMQCAKEQIACRASGNASRDMHCAEVLECSNDHDCTKTACYCLPTDFFPICGGPCMREIDSAAMAEPGGGTPLGQQNDSSTALGRAVDTTDCNAMKCADVCP